MIVVDTNVLVYAVQPGEHTEAALQVLERDDSWVAPPFWRMEMRNVLALSMRVAGMDLETALAAFTAAEGLVEDLNFEPGLETALALTQETGISAYDAEFVLAARHLGVPLVTADRRLVRNAPEYCISLNDFASV